MILLDTYNLHNHNIIENHDYRVKHYNDWIEHYNAMISFCFDSYQKQTLQQEFNSYKFYDC
jgi:hypothetical protein